MAERRQNSKNTLLKVVILGEAFVGKSCLMNRFVADEFDEHSFTTIGVEFLNKNIEIDGRTYTLTIWDTAGQERFKTLRTPFYRGSDICMLVYAVNDRGTFECLDQWRKEFLRYSDIKNKAQFPFIIVGNKSDVPLRDRDVSLLELETWCNDHNIKAFIETSAKNTSNVYEAFKMAVEQWRDIESKADNTEFDHERIDLRKHLGNKTPCCAGATKL